MRLLIGSQNFGYNTEESDKDWMEFVYPTWNDIIANKIISKEQVDEDGTHTKIYDIRKIRSIIYTGHFSQIQFMFSVEQYGCSELQWFTENRQRLVRVNPYRSYTANSANMIQDLNKKVDSKTVTRAHAFNELMEQLLRDEEFKLYNRDTYKYRVYTMSLSDKELCKEKERIEAEMKQLRYKFAPFEEKIDMQALKLVDAEILRLLKNNLEACSSEK